MNAFTGYKARRVLSRHAGTIALNVLALAALSIATPALAADYYGYGAPRYGATTYAPQPRYVESYAPVDSAPVYRRVLRETRVVVITDPPDGSSYEIPTPNPQLGYGATQYPQLWRAGVSAVRRDAVSAVRARRIRSIRRESVSAVWGDDVSAVRLRHGAVSAGLRPSQRPGLRSGLSGGADAAHLRTAGRSSADHHAIPRSALRALRRDRTWAQLSTGHLHRSRRCRRIRRRPTTARGSPAGLSQ